MKRRHNHPRLKAAGIVLAAATAGALLIPAAPASAAIPTLTRAEIIARAESGIGTNYTWGRESWVPDSPGSKGPDCSGYGLKCWEVPKTLLYQEEQGENASFSPRYTSYDFYNCRGPWSALSSRSLLLEGDILAKNDGTSGHVVIYAKGDAWNSPVIYEAPGTGMTIRRVSRYLGSEYKPLRRDAVVDAAIILDNPTAKSVGGDDVGGNWTRSTSVSGYRGDNYQVHAATTDTAWVRWTPRFPSSGSYDIYMRWTSASDRASGALVTVNTPSGQYKRIVNQRINGSTWFSLGRYSFAAGYSPATGGLTLYATGANGWVIADAVMFVPAP
jgi:hypothetical protein